MSKNSTNTTSLPSSKNVSSCEKSSSLYNEARAFSTRAPLDKIFSESNLISEAHYHYGTDQFHKSTNMPESLLWQDFEKIEYAKIIRKTDNLKIGLLEDGRKIIARLNSDDGRPTLEIQDPKNTRLLKIRYGGKPEVQNKLNNRD